MYVVLDMLYQVQLLLVDSIVFVQGYGDCWADLFCWRKIRFVFWGVETCWGCLLDQTKQFGNTCVVGCFYSSRSMSTINIYVRYLLKFSFDFEVWCKIVVTKLSKSLCYFLMSQNVCKKQVKHSN